MSSAEVQALRDQLARVEAQNGRIETMLVGLTKAEQLRAPLAAPEPLTAEQAMTLLGYTDRTSFNRAVRREGIPHTKITARLYQYDPVQLQKWKDARNTKARRAAPSLCYHS